MNNTIAEDESIHDVVPVSIAEQSGTANTLAWSSPPILSTLIRLDCYGDTFDVVVRLCTHTGGLNEGVAVRSNASAGAVGGRNEPTSVRQAMCPVRRNRSSHYHDFHYLIPL
eukprot:2459857-Rhodomonas_salina.1